ncbi:MAG: TetR/AcrR family transcriptional regulator [Lachnospiraceae bacterium]|nr:TetR/AcrR family transcriptional regulator [Lachnospiraceae bacterium]
MSIFTVEKRNQIQEKLLEVGIELIREKGIRKMTISEIADRTGIGKGTFYHFYDSKEYFAYDAIMYSKNQIKEMMNTAVEQYGKLNRDSLEEVLLTYSFGNDTNILSYISGEDMQWLLERLPKSYTLDPPKETDVINAILENCDGIKKDINYHVIANIMKIMAIAVENKERLYPDALEMNLGMLREQLFDCIFEN